MIKSTTMIIQKTSDLHGVFVLIKKLVNCNSALIQIKKES